MNAVITLKLMTAFSRDRALEERAHDGGRAEGSHADEERSDELDGQLPAERRHGAHCSQGPRNVVGWR